MRFFKRLQTAKDIWFVIGISVFFFLLRLPSFFEPYWYGDEGIYEVIGFALRHGRLLYRDIWDNKPPLLYLIYALFDGSQSPVRIFSFLVGIISIILFLFLAKKLFSNKWTVYTVTTIFTILLGLPLIEGNIANAENFMILPSVGAALLVISLVEDKLSKKKQQIFLALAGISLGLSLLTKIVAVFDVAAFWVFIFIVKSEYQKSFIKLVKEAINFSLIFISSFLLPLFITLIFFATQGAFKLFLQSSFFSNIGYVNYGNQFIIPQGLLVVKLILLFAFCIFLFFKKKLFSKTQLFIFIWLSFSLFSALFSQRPYTHYMLVAIASFSLFAGFLLEKGKMRIVYSLIFIGIIIFAWKNFWFYDKSFSYYANFAKYTVGVENTIQYQSFFDKVTPRDYGIVEYLNTVRKENDPIFVWGNSAQIYRLLNVMPPGKYTVAYHITSTPSTIKETQNSLIHSMPKYVIILQNAETMPYQLKHYSLKVQIDNAIIYERIY
ncbi:MAG TPA: phospholipid carrier-dependent glycosyltransferase [Patescibacteria group bacterium]